MCPTPIGRLHTRVAIIFLPAVLGAILWAITGREDWLVLIGIYLLLGVALDTAVYSWAVRWQPPWMTFLLALFELGLLYVIANEVKLELSTAEAIIFYWVAWVLAIWSKIVFLPLISLTYLESAGEFRRVEWSIPESQVPLPVGAISEEEARAGPGPVLREASGVHAAPLKRIPSPSAIHEVPAAMQGGS